MIIGIDFDGTLVDHQFPKLGKAVPGAIETGHALMAAGHQISL